MWTHTVIVFIVSRVHSWAEKLGVELWNLGEYVTSREEIRKVSFSVISFRFKLSEGSQFVWSDAFLNSTGMETT
jgi:hypothetical protein